MIFDNHGFGSLGVTMVMSGELGITYLDDLRMLGHRIGTSHVAQASWEKLINDADIRMDLV